MFSKMLICFKGTTKLFVDMVRQKDRKQKGFVMSKKPTPKPTDSELEILRILWEAGPSTVKTVNERLNKIREVGYTTTLKILQIMFEKGLVNRNDSERSHIYNSAIAESDIQTVMVNKLLTTVFSGSAAKLVMQVLGNSNTSKEELIKIKELLNKIERDQK
jgi:predicted transcriptional regulator